MRVYFAKVFRVRTKKLHVPAMQITRPQSFILRYVIFCSMNIELDASFFNIQMAQDTEILPLEHKDANILQSQYHGLWWFNHA